MWKDGPFSRRHCIGVVVYKQYHQTLTGKRFNEVVTQYFPRIFAPCGGDAQGRMFLPDGDHRENSRIAQNTWEALGCIMFLIPARAPDLNPIDESG